MPLQETMTYLFRLFLDDLRRGQPVSTFSKPLEGGCQAGWS